MPFYTDNAKVDFEKLWAALDADFDEKFTGERHTVNGFLEKPSEPRTRALFGADFLALKSPMPTFSTNAAWRQKVEIVKKLEKNEYGKKILKNPFLSYIFLRSTDNENFQNLIKKHPLWKKIFE